jgi:hypothetical protein
MNTKKIIFSGIITTAVGTGLGCIALYLAPNPYTSKPYSDLTHTYALIGGIAGLLIGSSQEAVRQLKKERDEEEALAEQFKRAKASFSRLSIDTSPFINPSEENHLF